MRESLVNFSKVIKGTHKPFEATIFVESYEGDCNCTLTELEIKGEKIEGWEQNLRLQEPVKYTPKSKTPNSSTVGKGIEDDRDFERTFVSYWGGAIGRFGDDLEGKYLIQWEKLVFKQFGHGYDEQEEMVWVSLGEEGENILTTENWKA